MHETGLPQGRRPHPERSASAGREVAGRERSPCRLRPRRGHDPAGSGRGERRSPRSWPPTGGRSYPSHSPTGTNFTQTGFGTSTDCPVGLSWPVSGSIRKTTIVAGVLVGGEQERAGRVDAEVARGLAAGRLVADRREPAGRGVDREDRDAVVAAVRAVEELARGMDLHLGRRVARRDLRPRRAASRWSGSRFKVPSLGVVVEGGHRAGHLVDHVGVPAVGMEREVARAGAGRDRAADGGSLGVRVPLAGSNL